MRPLSELPAPEYEPTDASVRFVLVNVAVVVLGIALCLVVAAGLYRTIDPARRPAGPQMTFRHGATEESAIAGDWRAEEAAVHQHLDTYEWVDRRAGIVRIPLERAMDLMVRETTVEPKAAP